MTDDLRAALKAGELSEAQLKELIALRAENIGLTFRQAVTAFHKDDLPGTADGADLALLISLLEAVPA
jgi:hypothetical protein